MNYKKIVVLLISIHFCNNFGMKKPLLSKQPQSQNQTKKETCIFYRLHKKQKEAFEALEQIRNKEHLSDAQKKRFAQVKSKRNNADYKLYIFFHELAEQKKLTLADHVLLRANRIDHQDTIVGHTKNYEYHQFHAFFHRFYILGNQEPTKIFPMPCNDEAIADVLKEFPFFDKIVTREEAIKDLKKHAKEYVSQLAEELEDEKEKA